MRNALLSLLIVALFFGGLELYQRVRFYIRTHDESYLFYGATGFELSCAKFFNQTKHKRPGEERAIAVVGGSTVRCDGLRPDLAWPKQLEDMINRDGGRNAVVWSLGKQGSKSSDDVARLQDFLRGNSVRLIIFYSGINDSTSLRVVKTGGSYILQEDLGVTFLERLNAWLMKHSLFYTTLREKSAKIFKKDINECYRFKDRHKADALPVNMEGLGKERFRSNLLKTIRLARNLKIGLVFGSPPSAVSAEESPYATFYDALRDEMRKVSDENNVLYIDVHSRFNSIPDKEKLFFPDRVHVNKQGAELEARMVYDFLKERRVLDSL